MTDRDGRSLFNGGEGKRQREEMEKGEVVKAEAQSRANEG